MIPIAFDEDTVHLLDKNKINWSKMIDRSIISKAEHIFEALHWDFSEIKPPKIKKEYKKKLIPIEQEITEELKNKGIKNA